MSRDPAAASDDVDKSVESLIAKIVKATANKADMSALTSAGLERWGGFQGLMGCGFEIFNDPDTTNHNKVQIWKEIINLVKVTHQLEPPSDESVHLDDPDLKAAIGGLLGEIGGTGESDDGTVGGSESLLQHPD